jgi:hypothetical protein
MGMGRSGQLVVLLLATATACSGPEVAEHPPEQSRASVLCQEKVDGFTEVDVQTVATLESIGPAPNSPSFHGRLTGYAPTDVVAMCLEPTGGGEADVWGIVISDPDAPRVKLWTQSPDDHFEWPI